VANAAGVSGASLLTLNLDAAAAAVQKIPAVKSAKVVRVWPHGVTIEVTEHQAWGYWQAGPQRLVIDETGARLEDKVAVGRVLIDGTRLGEVADEVLRDRRHLAEDGLVVPVVAINTQNGTLEGVPELITRGFVMENAAELLADGARLLSEVIEQSSAEERTDLGVMKEKVRTELRRFLRKRSGRRPFVLPVIMEI